MFMGFRVQARPHNPATSRLLQMPVELGIEPTLCNQLLVIALFGNAPPSNTSTRSACFTADKR